MISDVGPAVGGPVINERKAADFKIVESVLAGDKEAYAELVRVHQMRVFRFCLMLLSNPSEAEDAAQDVFVKAYEALPDFRRTSSFSTWISRIAHNYCMDILRKKARRKTDSLESLVETDQDRLAVLGEVDKATPFADGQHEIAREALAAIRPDYKEILLLREVAELSYEEIASTLRCTIDAVKARLKRARHELKDKARHFLGSEAV